MGDGVGGSLPVGSIVGAGNGIIEGLGDGIRVGKAVGSGVK